MSSRRSVTILFLLGAWSVTLGCGGDAAPAPSAPAEPSPPAPAPVGTMTVTDSDCELEGIDGPIRSGTVSFSAVNETDALAAFNIAAIEEGHTFADLEAHINREIELAEAGEEGLGHPPYAVPLFEVLLEPGESGTMSGTLGAPGTYGILCARFYEATGELRPAGALGPVEVS